MKSLLLDQGVSARAAGILRGKGWNALHVLKWRCSGRKMWKFLPMLPKKKRIVVTLDRDFPQILALTEAVFPSVILIRRERLRTDELVALLENVFERHEQDLKKGCVLSVGAKSTRLRLLPLT
jgi:predicted nuclease of predicted toxin-antitoxin system